MPNERQYRPGDLTNPTHYRDPRGECIDHMPEHFRKELLRLDPDLSEGDIAARTHYMMLGFCMGNAFKYRWRAGSKEGEPAAKDHMKGLWYEQFAEHMLSPNTTRDPRDRG